MDQVSSGKYSRRNFLAAVSAAASFAGAVSAQDVPPVTESRKPFKGQLCFFSKPLPEMGWRDLARNAKRTGFDGIDLTVRRGGHVVPGRVAGDLPRAVAAIREEGLKVPMITTELVSGADPTARLVLSTASKLSIPFFKPGYYRYDFVDVRRELERAAQQFRGLVELAKDYGLQVGYHNHEEYIGAPVWDMASVIEPLDPKWAGYYFDPRHAVAEGGVGAWKIALSLVLLRLKMVAVKDFHWEKTPKGWQARNCALGQGMVDWKYVFSLLARSNFAGPISLHMEYQVSGSTRAAQEENILAAVHRDLEFLKARLWEAYGES